MKNGTMKRRALRLAALTLACLLAVGPAGANSWGLTGALYGAVEQSKAWDEYSTVSNQAGPFAVMGARYHNALFCVDGAEELHVYTAAVWQPEDKRKDPALRLEDGELTLRYGDGETYVFRPEGENGEYLLSGAEIGGFRLSRNENEALGTPAYRAEEGDETALWWVKIRLSDFNIRAFPRSVGDVRRMNLMRAQLDSGLQCLGFEAGTGDNYTPDRPGELLRVGKKGTTPVYSAPFGKSAWRAGKGKAAVGLNGDIWLLSRYRNEDGQSYACIRYDVSERTQRIGYALCGDLGLPEITEWHPEEPLEGFAHVDVEAAADTWLTDDPDVSQYRQFEVPAGTQFTCMGLYNDFYAYVGAEVKKEKFTDGGAVVWGFVPVRDLKPMAQEERPEAAERLTGGWKLEAGGSMADDLLVFRADGTFTAGTWDWETDTPERAENAADASGTWTVTAYNPFMNLYWDKPPYQLTLTYDSGRVVIRGLHFDGTGFGLTDAEGGGGYVPATEEETELIEDHG